MSEDYAPPPGARTAASLLLLRDGAAGPEVLMLLRPERDHDQHSRAAVFPGGVLEAGDREAHGFVVGATDAALSARYGLRRGLLDYAVAAVRETFEEVGLHRIEVNVRPENLASLAVVERLGFRSEGTRLRFLHIDGAWRDHLSFALTVEDLAGARLADRVRR